MTDRQLVHFERVTPNAGRIYSKSFELWDQMPKFVEGAIIDSSTGKPVQKGETRFSTQARQFQHDGKRYSIEITPARIRGDVDKLERDYFPGRREMVIEQAIRKIAIHRHLSQIKCTENGRIISVKFKVQDLKNELSAQCHTYNWVEIRKSLFVSSGVIITITDDTENIISRAPLFTHVAFPAKGTDGYASVGFHPLVYIGVESLSHRQIAYSTLMSLKSSLAQYLYRRFVHRFRQANYVENRFKIKASTILAESGLCGYTRLRDRLSAVQNAVEELQQRRVLSDRSSEEPLFEGRRWIDSIWTVAFSSELIDDIKMANISDTAKNHLGGPGRS